LFIFLYWFIVLWVCFSKNNFWEIIFQTFCIYLPLKKINQQKTLSNQRKILFYQKKFSMIFIKVFFFIILNKKYFEQKIISIFFPFLLIHRNDSSKLTNLLQSLARAVLQMLAQITLHGFHHRILGKLRVCL